MIGRLSLKKLKLTGIGLLSLMTMISCGRKFSYDTDSNNKSGVDDTNLSTGDSWIKKKVTISFSGGSSNYSNPAVIYLVNGSSPVLARDQNGNPTLGGYDGGVGDPLKITKFSPISFTAKPSGIIDIHKLRIVPFDDSQDPFCNAVTFMVNKNSIVLQNSPTNKLSTMTTCLFKFTSSTYEVNDTKIELLFNYTVKDWESSLGDGTEAQKTASLIDIPSFDPATVFLSNSYSIIKDISPITALINLGIIDLRSNQISVIPRSISELVNLNLLDLRGNLLTDLPNSFSTLVALQKLLLGYNKFTTIPNSISMLKKLQVLEIRNNKITVIPDFVFKLTSLNKLWLSNNQIAIIPNIPKSTANFSNLTELLVDNNQIVMIPNSISEIKSLQILGLNHNQILNVPDSLVSLTRLGTILLSYNQIETISKGTYSWITGITNSLEHNPGYATHFGN